MSGGGNAGTYTLPCHIKFPFILREFFKNIPQHGVRYNSAVFLQEFFFGFHFSFANFPKLLAYSFWEKSHVCHRMAVIGPKS